MFHALLADLPPDTGTSPASLRAWLECLFFLGGGLYILLAIRKQMRPTERTPVHLTGQPIRIEREVEFTPLEAHRKLEAKVDRITDQITAGFDKADGKRSSSIAGLHDDLRNATEHLRTEMKSDNTGLHNRLSEVLVELGELRGQVKGRRPEA